MDTIRRALATPWTGHGPAILLAAVWASCGPLAAQEVRYNRDVLPILAENCFACHGFDRARREAGLRLDSQAPATTVLESGARAIVAGHAEQSALVERITATDPDLRMPPASTGKQLTAVQVDTLRRWIDEGARYEVHWALLPPVRPQPPAGEGEQPIDRFILARLAAEQIEPAPRPTALPWFAA